jgi:broad specificity phosphatase PhoE
MRQAKPRSSLTWLLMTFILAACIRAPTLTPAPTVTPTATAIPATATTPTAPAPTVLDASVVALLRQGGYVIYFRHALTDHSQTDNFGGDYLNCDKQRNLTDEGRNQARAIGAAFKQLQIPVGRVIASPYCRTRETAQLIFGEKFETLPSYADTKETAQQLLTTAPAQGVNTVLVAHGFIIQDIAGLMLAEGEAAIFKPQNPNDLGLVGVVPSELWGKWAQ